MVINRNGAGSITPPSGWTTLLSAFGGANGDGIVQWFPVTNVSSLPANWSWNATGARQGIVIFRVTGANLVGELVSQGFTQQVFSAHSHLQNRPTAPPSAFERTPPSRVAILFLLGHENPSVQLSAGLEA